MGVARKRFPVGLRSWVTQRTKGGGDVIGDRGSDGGWERDKTLRWRGKKESVVYVVMAVKSRREKKSGYGKKT